MLAKIGPHGFEHFRKNRGGGVVVEVNAPHHLLILPAFPSMVARSKPIAAKRNGARRRLLREVKSPYCPIRSISASLSLHSGWDIPAPDIPPAAESSGYRRAAR